MNRVEAIKFLIDLGCKDLTKEIYPRKVNKYYFKLNVSRGSSITFDIDYPGYDELSINWRRKNISEFVKFNELPAFLEEMKIIN